VGKNKFHHFWHALEKSPGVPPGKNPSDAHDSEDIVTHLLDTHDLNNDPSLARDAQARDELAPNSSEPSLRLRRSNTVVPNRWVATPKWVAEEFLWGREQQPQ